MMTQNVHITQLKDEGSQPRGVTLGGVPTQEESPPLQTCCCKEDRLNLPPQRGSVYTLVEPDLWSNKVMLVLSGGGPTLPHSSTQVCTWQS